MRRVLYALNLDPSRKFGSLEEQICLLARAFRERSGLFLPLFSVAPGAESAEEFRAEGVEPEGLDLLRFRPETLRRLVSLIRRHRIELVHWNFYDPVKNGYLWALSVLTPWVKHAYTDHISREVAVGPELPAWKRRVKGALFGRYERVHAVSDFVRDDLQRRLTPARVGRWAHFVNTERFRPDPEARAETRRALDAGERFVLLVVAQLHAGKGVEVVLRALRSLPDSVVVWVVGSGDERARLEGLCREWSLAERVRFLGVLRNVAPAMQGADALVCPSLWAEAAGLVILEGMGCGLPVVASRIGGIPEFVQEGTTGFLVPPGDHEQLALSLQRLHGDPTLCRDQGRAARAAVVERHSAEQRIPEILELYRPPGPRWHEARLVPPVT